VWRLTSRNASNSSSDVTLLQSMLVLLARRAAPNPDGRFEHTRHSTPLHGVHSTTEGHLGVNLMS
jgi:hypothetical protein